MATFYCDSLASSGGDGSIGTPWNTFAGITWGSLTTGDTLNFSGTFTEALIPATDGIILDGKHSGVITVINANGFLVGLDCDSRDGVEIKGFNVKSATNQNIEVNNSTNCHVHSCLAENSGFDDMRLKHSSNCSIKYCVSMNPTRRSFTLSTANVGVGMSDCIIENCASFGAGLRGYTMSGDTASSLITNSTIKNCLAQDCLEGLQVNNTDSGCVLEDLRLIDNGDTGIYEVSNVSGAEFKNIDIVGGTQPSINNIEDVTDVTFDNIRTRGSVSHGFKFMANTSVTRVTIKNCEITGASNNGAYGLYTDSGMTINTLVVDNNLFSGNDLMVRLHSNWLNSSITNNTFSFNGVTGTGRDAISLRTAQSNELIISRNVFEGIEAQCIDETTAFAHNLTTSENYYSGLAAGLVKINGTTYTEATIDTFEATRILYRQDAYGFIPVVSNTSSTSTSGVSADYMNSTNLPSGRDFGTKRYSDNDEIIPNYIHTDFPDA